MRGRYSSSGEDWSRPWAPQGIDPLTFLQLVLRESYLETSAELRDYADKVKFFNREKKRLRAELQMEKATETPMTAVQMQNRSPRLAGARLRSGVQRARKLLQNSRRIQTDLYNAAMSIVRASPRGMTRGGVRPPHAR